MSERSHPRRPAMLGNEDAEYIVGNEDPAVTSEVAHISALALIGKGQGELGAEEMARLTHAIENQGVDIVAELWSDSPATTLPGILWRLYLISEWFRRDEDTVRRRWQEGIEDLRFNGKSVETPDLDELMAEIQKLMRGTSNESLENICTRAAVVLRVMAIGATFGSNWIIAEDHELADAVTRRAGALLITADELAEGALRAQSGELF